MRSLIVFFLLFAIALAQRGGHRRGSHSRGSDEHDDDHHGHGHGGRPRFPFPFPRPQEVCHSCVRQPLFISSFSSQSPCVFQPGTQLSCTSCCQSVASQQSWGVQYRGAFLMQFGSQWSCSCCFDTFNCRQ
ncbi:unnamed protein product, partial [Mesorhabditis belari]|uniref:Secreted protein n=1 Tax=Mesorhabditis belari TaxID=2138241 RepID=A0AAF3F392_9BILA